jgi:hypothetical protein
LYNVYQYAIGYEVHLYLEALNGAKGIEVELIVATDLDDPDNRHRLLAVLAGQGRSRGLRRGVYGGAGENIGARVLRAGCCGRWSAAIRTPS